MRGLMVQLAVAAAITVLYVCFAWARKRVQRSRPVRPGPSTPDLREEPPAVVNLLVRRNITAPQAASATLLDLAARRVVEIFQTADDPEHTIISGGSTHRPTCARTSGGCSTGSNTSAAGSRSPRPNSPPAMPTAAICGIAGWSARRPWTRAPGG
jgi:hypothetical protein